MKEKMCFFQTILVDLAHNEMLCLRTINKYQATHRKISLYQIDQIEIESVNASNLGRFLLQIRSLLFKAQV